MVWKRRRGPDWRDALTDRIQSLTVTLHRDYRDDDVQAIIEAIRMVRGVLDVTGVVADMDSHVARERTRRAWRQVMADALETNADI